MSAQTIASGASSSQELNCTAPRRRYRKIDTGIWGDQKFRALSQRGKLVFFFLLTHPHLTMLGAMRATVPGLAAELKMPRKIFVQAFAEILNSGIGLHDENASLFCFRNFMKHNKPESPNVVKSWPQAFGLLPECPLKLELFEKMKTFCEGLTEGYRNAFREAFTEAFTKPLPNQEQEQEHEQESEQEQERLSGSLYAPGTQGEPDSADTRILCELVGIFDIREQEAMHRCMVAYAKACGKSPPELIKHMAGRWREYQKANVRWRYGSSHKFFMSGKWDSPENWDREEADGPTSEIDRILAKEAQRRGISGFNGADAPDGAAVPVEGSGAKTGELPAGLRAARGAPHVVRRA